VPLEGTPFDDIDVNGPTDGASAVAGGSTARFATPFDDILTEAPTTTPPADEASQTRQMLVSGLTGMPTPNMNAEDRASFQRGQVAGALSVPAVTGAAALSSPAAADLLLPFRRWLGIADIPPVIGQLQSQLRSLEISLGEAHQRLARLENSGDMTASLKAIETATSYLAKAERHRRQSGMLTTLD